MLQDALSAELGEERVVLRLMRRDSASAKAGANEVTARITLMATQQNMPAAGVTHEAYSDEMCVLKASIMMFARREYCERSWSEGGREITDAVSD